MATSSLPVRERTDRDKVQAHKILKGHHHLEGAATRPQVVNSGTWAQSGWVPCKKYR